MELSLGNNIRKMRKERGLTQESLADTLGVTNGAVYKWESNQSVPELEMIVKLADLFDLDRHDVARLQIHRRVTHVPDAVRRAGKD